MKNEFTRASVATLTIIVCATLIGLGHDGEIKAILGATVGFFFGQYIPEPQKDGKS